jgi:hypothetical protein
VSVVGFYQLPIMVGFYQSLVVMQVSTGRGLLCSWNYPVVKWVSVGDWLVKFTSIVRWVSV